MLVYQGRWLQASATEHLHLLIHAILRVKMFPFLLARRLVPTPAKNRKQSGLAYRPPREKLDGLMTLTQLESPGAQPVE